MSVIKHLDLSQSHFLDMNRAEIVANPDRVILNKCNAIQDILRDVEADCRSKEMSYTTMEGEKKSCRDLLNYLEEFKVSGTFIKDDCLRTFPMLTVRVMSHVYDVKLDWEKVDLDSKFIVFYQALKDYGFMALEIRGPPNFTGHSFVVIEDSDGTYVVVETFSYDKEFYATTVDRGSVIRLIDRYLKFLRFGKTSDWNTATDNKDILSRLYPDKIDPSQISGYIGVPRTRAKIGVIGALKRGIDVMSRGLATTQKIAVNDPIAQERMSLADVVRSSIVYGR